MIPRFFFNSPSAHYESSLDHVLPFVEETRDSFLILNSTTSENSIISHHAFFIYTYNAHFNHLFVKIPNVPSSVVVIYYSYFVEQNF